MRNLIAVVLLLGCGVAQAAPVTWTLGSVVFDDGGTAAGQFDYDAALNIYSNVNIVTRNGGVLSEFNYDFDPINCTPGLECPGNSSEEVGFQVSPRVFQLVFVESLTNAGGTIGLGVDSSSFEFQSSAFKVRYITAGSVSAVPIPAAVYLFASGLGLLGWFRRRQTA